MDGSKESRGVNDIFKILLIMKKVTSKVMKRYTIIKPKVQPHPICTFVWGAAQIKYHTEFNSLCLFVAKNEGANNEGTSGIQIEQEFAISKGITLFDTMQCT